MSIEVKNLYKSFNSHNNNLTVLEDINLKIEDREFICLLGPSGCGKTTLLRLIAGLDKPDSGEIYDNGKLVDKPSGDRDFIFQQYSLFPWMTVLDNVLFGLNISKDKSKGDTSTSTNKTNTSLNISKDKSKEENIEDAKRYLERVGLSDFTDSYPHELSGGMKQRVAIIRSLLKHTPILLMDEPFSALDMQNRHKLQEQLIGVWERFDNTIIFVTHDVDEAVYLADKVVIMDKDQILNQHYQFQLYADKVVIMDKDPGKIKKIVDIKIPRLRNRESPEFIKAQNDILEDLDVWD